MYENKDRTELMMAVLDRHDARYKPSHTGWQTIRCVNTEAHSHGDRTPSGSVNLRYGKYHCWACGLRGDGFDLMLEIEGMKAKEALEALELGTERGKKEATWIV